MIGRMVSHYRVLEELGRGGMGVVYKAEDTRLHRNVALKFPPESIILQGTSRERFLREARALATVNHPNVAHIYGVDEFEGGLFIVMELVDGSTLQREIESRGSIPLPEAFRIAGQIAEGLQAIHTRAVVHRDIKSSNVLIDRAGQAKITDFGLALLSGRSRVTREGATVGTVAYMSPEQAQGEEVDRRTDLWSFGVILYEMLTGSLPFSGTYEQAVIYNILNSPPPSPASLKANLPPNVLRVIETCLQKDPAVRYPDAESLLKELRGAFPSEKDAPPVRRRTGTGGFTGKVISAAVALLLLIVAGTFWLFVRGDSREVSPLSIAILPFENLGDSSSAYATVGIADAISSELGTIPGFTVIGSRGAARIVDREGDMRKAARELGVRYVLEGSVQRSPTTFRIFARVLDAQSYVQIWGEKFERSPDDLIPLEDEIAGHIVSALAPNVPETGRTTRHPQPATSSKAYDLYLSGRYFLDRTPFEKTDTAITLFQQAIALDPHFALAYAALGRAYSVKVFANDLNSGLEEKASVAIEKALASDPQLAEAYVARATLLWTRTHGFPHERAARELLKAIAINPNLVEAQEALGSIYFHIGLLDKALEHLQKALFLDPMSTFTPPRIARILWFQQQYTESLEGFRELPAGQWREEKARVLYYLGRTTDAFRILLDSTGRGDINLGPGTRPLADTSSDIASSLSFLHASTGDTAQALREIDIARQKGESSSHFHHTEYNIACAYALMKKNAQAVEWLQKTAEDGFPCYPLFRTDPMLSSLRSDPQYRALLDRMKKEWEHWNSTLD